MENLEKIEMYCSSSLTGNIAKVTPIKPPVISKTGRTLKVTFNYENVYYFDLNLVTSGSVIDLRKKLSEFDRIVFVNPDLEDKEQLVVNTFFVHEIDKANGRITYHSSEISKQKNKISILKKGKLPLN